MQHSVDDLFGTFMSPKEICLARLFTDKQFPAGNYRPTVPVTVENTEVEKTNVTIGASANFSGKFTLKLSELLNIDLNHERDDQVTLTIDRATISSLIEYVDASQTLFNSGDIRNWIQEQWRACRHVYMVVGYVVVGKTQVDGKEKGTTTVDGSVTVNVADVWAPGTVAALAPIVHALGIGNPSTLGAVTATADGSHVQNNSLVYALTDPTIVAIAYREVHYKVVHSPLGSAFDFWRAKTSKMGDLHAESLCLGSRDHKVLYLPTRGL